MKLNSIFVILMLFISILYVNTEISHALKERYVSTPDLARTSSDIVVAKCVSSEAKIDNNTGMIFTYITFDIDESLKGTNEEKLTLKVVGGTVGDITVSSPYLPDFEPGNEVVLFLGPTNPDGYPVLQSIHRGVYRVSVDSQGTRVIDTPVNDLNIYSAVTNQRVSGKSKLSLDDFIYSLYQKM